MTWSWRSSGLFLSLLLVGSAPARAQSVGIGAGLAGVENYDPSTPAVAIHLQTPTARRLSFVGAYVHWFGEDGNRDDLAPGRFYGDDGLSLVGMYDVVVRGRSVIWSVGGGLAQYEMETVFEVGEEEESDFVGAIALATLLRVRVGGLNAFVRGEVAAPTTELRPRWGYLVVGF